MTITATWPRSILPSWQRRRMHSKCWNWRRSQFNWVSTWM